MATDARGIAVNRTGWAGTFQVTIGATTETITAADSSSSLEILSTGAAKCSTTFYPEIFAVSTVTTGKLVLSCTAGFTLVTTGVAATRSGFTSTPFTGAASYQADAIASDSFHIDDQIRFTLDVPTPPKAGITLSDRAVLVRTPGTDWKSPVISVALLRADSLRLGEVLDLADTPGKISILVGSVIHTGHMGRAKFATRDSVSGWCEATIEVIL